jgi:diacylglycerol O-acyltransferase-1
LAYLIELAAAREARHLLGRRKKAADGREAPGNGAKRDQPQWTWRLIGCAHALNATLCLGFTTACVYWVIHHPLIGTLCELHTVIVWLKICSYAFTNRDLRRALLDPPDADEAQRTNTWLPAIYSTCPYPQNISVGNLSYFWWAPTLVYQPVYPRSGRVRWGFVAKRSAEVAGLSTFIWVASAQYAAPLLLNSLDKVQARNLPSIAERLMKLSTIAVVIWLAGFFALFHSFLNALAEVTRFGDREFYTDWWNSASFATYWRSWNRPVYHFMKRHVFSPLVGRGWSPKAASAAVFVFSAVLHEMLVGVPTHNIIGEDFWLFGFFPDDIICFRYNV